MLKPLAIIIGLALLPLGYVVFMFNVMDWVVTLTRGSEVVGVVPMLNSYKDVVAPLVRAIAFLSFFVSLAVIRDYIWRRPSEHT